MAIELTAPCCAQVHYRQAAPSPPGRCFPVPPKSWWWGKRACVHMHTSTISSFSVLWENKLTSNFLLNWFLLLWPLRKALGAKWWDIHWYQRKREWYWGFPVQPEAQVNTRARKDGSSLPCNINPTAQIISLAQLHKDDWCVKKKSLWQLLGFLLGFQETSAEPQTILLLYRWYSKDWYDWYQAWYHHTSETGSITKHWNQDWSATKWAKITSWKMKENAYFVSTWSHLALEICNAAWGLKSWKEDGLP